MNEPIDIAQTVQTVGIVILGLGLLLLLACGIPGLVVRKKRKSLSAALLRAGGLGGGFVIVLGVLILTGGRGLPKQERFDPKTYKKTTVTLSHNGPESATLIGFDQTKNKRWVFHPENSVFKIPHTTYSSWIYRIKNGPEEWELQSDTDLSKLKQMPPSLTASLRINRKAGTYIWINPVFTDASGNAIKYRASDYLGFEVVDQSGTVVWGAEFEYG